MTSVNLKPDVAVRDETARPPDVRLSEPVSLKVTGILVGIIGVLLLVHSWCAASERLFGIVMHDLMFKFWWFDNEFGFPAWFSGMILAAAGVLLGCISSIRRQLGWPAVATTVLAWGFILMSADEVVSLHEEFLPLLTRPFFPDAPPHIRTWTLVGGSIAFIVGVCMLPMLRRLPAVTRWMFLLAGFTFILGAVVTEGISGFFEEPESRFHSTAIYAVVMTIEETLEMVGVVIFIHALTSYLAALIRFQRRTATGA